MVSSSGVQSCIVIGILVVTMIVMGTLLHFGLDRLDKRDSYDQGICKIVPSTGDCHKHTRTSTSRRNGRSRTTTRTTWLASIDTLFSAQEDVKAERVDKLDIPCRYAEIEGAGSQGSSQFSGCEDTWMDWERRLSLPCRRVDEGVIEHGRCHADNDDFETKLLIEAIVLFTVGGCFGCCGIFSLGFLIKTCVSGISQRPQQQHQNQQSHHQPPVNQYLPSSAHADGVGMTMTPGVPVTPGQEQQQLVSPGNSASVYAVPPPQYGQAVQQSQPVVYQSAPQPMMVQQGYTAPAPYYSPPPPPPPQQQQQQQQQQQHQQQQHPGGPSYASPEEVQLLPPSGGVVVSPPAPMSVVGPGVQPPPPSYAASTSHDARYS